MTVATLDPHRAYLLLQAALGAYQRPPAELDDEQRRRAERQASAALAIQDRVLGSEQAAGVVVQDADVSAALRQIRERYPDADAFERDLARNGLTREGLTAAVAREQRVEATISRLTETAAQVDDTEVEIYYLQHADRFRRPETRTARQILITVNDAYPENRRDWARQRIDAVAAALDGSAERFSAHARRHSECPTAMDGGLLGQVTPGKLFPALEAALFALPEGGTTSVVESPLGFHLLHCERVTPAETLPLTQVGERIRERLAERKRRAFIKAWLSAG